jgi:hypothetical protein
MISTCYDCPLSNVCEFSVSKPQLLDLLAEILVNLILNDKKWQ